MKSIKTVLRYAVLALVSMGPLTVMGQSISTVAGNGILGYSGDGGPATDASIKGVVQIAVDAAGNLFLPEINVARVRKVNTAGYISTVVGTGVGGCSGDGGPATAAQLGVAYGVAVDAVGNLYIADAGWVAECIRKVDPSGTITTIAGVPGVSGFSGDGGPATAAHMDNPGGMTLDAAGNLYFVDALNKRVRKITPAGIINTVAGNGTDGSIIDGIPATSSPMQPTDVAVDAAGNLYILSGGPGNSSIRKVNTSGIISTLAGNGTLAHTGDGGPATAAMIYCQGGGIFVDAYNNIYFGEYANIVRKIDASGIITTVAGTGVAGYAEDVCGSIPAIFNRPNDVYLANGKLYVSDHSNWRIRMICLEGTPQFVGGAVQNMNACRNSVADINTILRVQDGDNGQYINWDILTPPVNGTLMSMYSSTTTGGTILPTGMTYTPFSGYWGADSFSVVVEDCTMARDTTTVYVTVDSGLIYATVSGVDSICPGETTTLLSSVTGGVWTTGAASIATVGATGTVTGVATGSATITYTLANGCGSTNASHTIFVRPNSQCVTEAAITMPQYEMLQVYPNPARGAFTINIATKQNEEVHVAISNMMGEKVAEYATTTNIPATVRLSQPDGVYIVTATTKEGTWSKRLISIR